MLLKKKKNCKKKLQSYLIIKVDLPRRDVSFANNEASAANDGKLTQYDDLKE